MLGDLLFSFKNATVARAEPSAYHHGAERDKIAGVRKLAEDGEGEGGADEGGDRVVGARSGGAYQALGVDVEEDAKPVSDEADEEDGENAPRGAYPFSEAEPDDDGTRAREDTF